MLPELPIVFFLYLVIPDSIPPAAAKKNLVIKI